MSSLVFRVGGLSSSAHRLFSSSNLLSKAISIACCSFGRWAYFPLSFVFPAASSSSELLLLSNLSVPELPLLELLLVLLLRALFFSLFDFEEPAFFLLLLLSFSVSLFLFLVVLGDCSRLSLASFLSLTG
jgi:hypothetical protein